MKISIAQIVIDERLRDEYGTDKDIEEFKTSIKDKGLLQPIVLSDLKNGSYKLVVGERRLRAVTQIHTAGDTIPNVPLGYINAEIMGELSPEMALMMEFEENERRKNFTWEEKAKYIKKIHDMWARRYKGNWTLEMTAHLLKIALGSVSDYLGLGSAMEKHPEIAKAETLRSAVKRAKNIKKQEVRRIEAEENDPEQLKRAESVVVCADARQWIKQVSEASIDLVNFDPPWGEEVSHKVAENWESFDDDTESADERIRDLLPEIFRVLKPDRFCIFWFRNQAYESTIELIESAGFSMKGSRNACLWIKLDKTTDQMRFPEKMLIHGYENFFLLRKGDPLLYKTDQKTNVFMFARVPRGLKIHPTEKPRMLLELLIKMTTTPGETVVDPCAGSGSTLHAAYNTMRKPLGCELSPNFHARIITRLTEVMGETEVVKPPVTDARIDEILRRDA